MNNILQLLDQVKERIAAYGYIDFSDNITLWRGADVIISPTLTEDIESWLGDQPIVISAQTLEPGRRAVITKYASALSWLFYELKYIFSNSIDSKPFSNLASFTTTSSAKANVRVNAR